METIAYFLGAFICFFVFRVLYLLYKIIFGKSQLKSDEPRLRTLISIGSGGHTTEMLRIVGTLNATKYLPRLYVMADNDVSSEVKIRKLEAQEKHFEIHRIPRSRNVNQSYFTSVFSTLRAMLHTFPIIYKFKPQVIIANGPGTCVPICFVAFFLRCLFILDCRVIFIESICRVRTLSLSGKIMQFLADVFIIQWPQLRDVCIRGQYFGRLT
ncbi:UDP-N-acetylglucosamine transferase subunit ALG14 homolog [Aricia agestis]|uniref:UDP-N-acetylglucosamine transferase subunit ALG14 homolog n=1 Tax=Aricia agestis TaxID=91739 RepID=UPI001C205547|nr:UDP-N-acetylglucosamine transferase subunit ALG14 homolog [Aricia agestis]